MNRAQEKSSTPDSSLFNIERETEADAALEAYWLKAVEAESFRSDICEVLSGQRYSFTEKNENTLGDLRKRLTLVLDEFRLGYRQIFVLTNASCITHLEDYDMRRSVGLRLEYWRRNRSSSIISSNWPVLLAALSFVIVILNTWHGSYVRITVEPRRMDLETPHEIVSGHELVVGWDSIIFSTRESVCKPPPSTMDPTRSPSPSPTLRAKPTLLGLGVPSENHATLAKWSSADALSSEIRRLFTLAETTKAPGDQAWDASKNVAFNSIGLIFHGTLPRDSFTSNACVSKHIQPSVFDAKGRAWSAIDLTYQFCVETEHKRLRRVFCDVGDNRPAFKRAGKRQEYTQVSSYCARVSLPSVNR
ncbi:hypothetical protein EV361DRAFT_872769 [Lentinula raphanica]|nr:hypothetical protein EV361DRAFT_872769 [Lentinula raphanica]